ncbi:recombinase XerC [Limosilactobacillus reuteri]|uniref:Recombinase XerC n=1 Tax=Limosilactobacillus reuteri TaxID=1598 RepID=A0A256VHA5_LIMRT|nr:tyrosine-type recombinase/integrase [Limosilactobacillus balticus]OYS57884.1 recombinase XerC [Limosilactobacillus reuteri]OYS59804.1 recombinase XerC [Limosilactobacillus reuteri]OYS63448.1 recombinase XerC [Limosilactobacillus reuteri]OYS71538.1 recombinase XerC [Limosilactobacillus reuteri]
MNHFLSFNAVNKVLRKILADLKIKRKNFHFHSLRHSHVALLLANGIDLYAISKRLGHSDIRTTSNTYAYLIDEYKKKTDDQITSALDKTFNFGEH